MLVTHSDPLIEALGAAVDADDLSTVELVKDLGETLVEGQGLLTKPRWEWGKR